MKKNFFTGLFLLLAFSIMLVGCKKDLSLNKENAAPIEPAQPSISNLKAWYGNQMSEQTSNVVGEKKPYYGIPDWGNTKFRQKENAFVTPLNIDNQKNNHVFLVTETNTSGVITSGKYVFVTMDEAHFKIIPKSSYGLDLLMGRYILSGTTGAIIVHDINSNVISSLRFKNGTLDNTKTDKLVYKNIKKSNTNFTGGATNNIIDDPYGVECTDWYLNTYADGELISSVYVGTTCTGNPNDGSGGGGGSGGEDPCVQQSPTFANAGGSVSGPINSVTLFNDGIDWEVNYDWKIFAAGTWGLFSYEKGILKKKTYSNGDRWEYQTFTHRFITDAGANIGGTRTWQDLGATINLSPTGVAAWVRIDYKVTSSVVGCVPLNLNYNANKIFYAP
jgi:hypothetical protein